MTDDKKNERKGKFSKRFSVDYYDKVPLAELKCLWDRTIIHHALGVYIPPPAKVVSQNKRKHVRDPREYEQDLRIKSTRFGTGRFGVSGHSYRSGDENCVCCTPKQKPIILGARLQINAIEPIECIDLSSSSSVIDFDDDPIEVRELISRRSNRSAVETITSQSLVANLMDELKYLESQTENAARTAGNLVNMSYAFSSRTNNDTEKPSTSTSSDYRPRPVPFTEVSNTLISSSEVIEIMDSPTPKQSSSRYDTENSKNSFDCPICLEQLTKTKAMVTMCGHMFCSECIHNCIRQTKKCAVCRKPLTFKRIHPVYL